MASWLTSTCEPWSFVEATGGIRILQPLEQNHRLVLPVDYNISGLKEITCHPTLVNSALGIRGVYAQSSGDRLWISVVGCVINSGSGMSAGGIHYADISNLKPGTYRVFYGVKGDTAHEIGSITIRAFGK